MFNYLIVNVGENIFVNLLTNIIIQTT